MAAHLFINHATNNAVVTVLFEVIPSGVQAALRLFCVAVLIQIRGLQRVGTADDRPDCFSSSEFTSVQWAPPGCSDDVDLLYRSLNERRGARAVDVIYLSR